MAYDNIETVHGQQFIFGFTATEQASISITGFAPRGVSTSDLEPEIFVTATNGEGHVEAIALSKPANKKITVTLTGYIDSSFNRNNVGNSFSLFSRFFLVTKVSDPRQKGEFVEVSIDAVSHPLVTS